LGLALLSAQRTPIDSLTAMLKTGKKDTSRVRLLIAASNELGETGDFDQAIKYSEQALDLSRELRSKEGEANAYSSLGLVYQYKGDYEKSIQYSLSALKFFEETNDQRQVTSLLTNIGNIYLNQQNFKKAEEYYLKALPKNGKRSAMINSNLGLLYTYTKQYSKALQCYKIALEVYREKGRKVGEGDVYTNMGIVYFDLKDYNKALELHLQALEIFKEAGDKRRLNISYENLGAAYIELKDFKKAEQNLLEALTIAQDIGDKEGVQTSAIGLVELYQRTGDFKKAYEYDLFSSDIKDSLVNEESGKQIAEMNTKYESEKKDKELLKKDAEITQQEEKSRQQSIIILSSVVGIVLATVMGLFILRSYREKRRINIAITEQKVTIELKNKEILDSIHYAKRIQRALLAGDQLLKNSLKEHFVLYRPKDIVSGDFYWAHHVDGKFLICTADCTGHGVPGAFMSLLNISILNEVTTEKKITQPDKILNYVRESIIVTLNTEGNEESKDGMDCTLCCFDVKNRTLEYAAANNSFYIIREGKLILCPADKMPVGKSPRDNVAFTCRTVELQSGDIIYTLTDGYADQFGGPRGKKFKYKPLEELLLANHHLSMSEQSKILEQTIISWKGSLEQVDDILIMGIRV
jgi:serine phosphatase RsbU (regulator of sigma subunit)/Tfp pilus assembly protein PilF